LLSQPDASASGESVCGITECSQGKKMTLDSKYYTYMDSPFGTILIARNSVGLSHISFQEDPNRKSPEAEGWRFDQEAFKETLAQLGAYFKSDLYHFDLPLAPEGTPFQLQVWQALQMIPYGETISYAELANKIGRPHAARAVGAANSKNPVPIVIPCHRVIGSNGLLTGYAGGIHLKEALLSLERRGRAKMNQQQMFTEFQTNLI
jgi:methylated-DNA-[protein]-cysteine S-methyltransferase